MSQKSLLNWVQPEVETEETCPPLFAGCLPVGIRSNLSLADRYFLTTQVITGKGRGRDSAPDVIYVTTPTTGAISERAIYGTTKDRLYCNVIWSKTVAEQLNVKSKFDRLERSHSAVLAGYQVHSVQEFVDETWCQTWNDTWLLSIDSLQTRLPGDLLASEVRNHFSVVEGSDLLQFLCDNAVCWELLAAKQMLNGFFGPERTYALEAVRDEDSGSERMYISIPTTGMTGKEARGLLDLLVDAWLKEGDLSIRKSVGFSLDYV